MKVNYSLKNLFFCLIFSLFLNSNCFAQVYTYCAATGNSYLHLHDYPYIDNDLDKYGSNTKSMNRYCTVVVPNGYAFNNLDCNDNNAAITNSKNWYLDNDLDGFGVTSTKITSCTKPITGNYVLIDGDCDDTKININPNTIWYTDNDNDGYGSSIIKATQCVQLPLSSLNKLDCDDNNNAIALASTWYADNDKDGFGDPASPFVACSQPVDYVSNNLDKCPGIKGTILGCIVPIVALGNDPNSFGNDMNFIITSIPKIETSNLQLITDDKNITTSITYFDGLGRPIQQIANQQSASRKDIVTYLEYDTFGRQIKDYLPFKGVNNNMAFDTNAKTNVLAYYAYPNTTQNGNPNSEATTNPFSEKLLESSPLNRVLKQAAPGNDWALNTGHEIKINYQTNTTLDAVKLFSVTANWDSSKGLFDIPTSLIPTDYQEFQLYKTITYDENTVANPTESSGSTVEFKNKEGQVILKRTYESGVKHDTYYVYDQFSNLTFVVPPLVDATTTISNTILDGLCYQYKYDYRNRLVEKKLPGKQWEFIVYDKLDRVVATGPSFSPFSDSAVGVVGWMITKYDVFNRPVYTGWELSATVTSADRRTKQTAMDSLSTISESKTTTPITIDSLTGIAYYTNSVTPTSFKLLTINYYDDYNFQAFTPAIAYTTPVAYNNSTLKPKGLPTGSWVRIPSTLSATTAESSYILYDAKAKPVKKFSTNYLGGYTQIDSNLDAFSGRLNYTETRHKRTLADSELYVKEAYTYSDQDRLLTHTHQIGTSGTPQLLASNTYDELGQLISKKVGNTQSSPLQKVDYAYNIRGWMTEINKVAALQQSTDPKDLFGFKINYNTIDGNATFTKKLYNGNIAETSWASSPVVRTYGYLYDNLNRLTDATYQKSGTTTQMYDENLTYDKNGNILTLKRNGDNDSQVGATPIDNLTYTYPTSSNQLQAVTDATNNTSGFKDGNTSGTDYTYDANGNMITDLNKGISNIVYNHLNLPIKITFGTKGTIAYIYNAIGQKVEKVVMNSLVGNGVAAMTDYLSGFQYVFNENNNSVYIWKLRFVPIAEGYYDATKSSYVYNFTEHLGNVRLSYSDADKNGTIATNEILEESSYYPFGMKHSYTMASSQPSYKYKYNGKELQDELGLNFYDYGARNYDPALGRWMNIDPHSENYYSISSYVSFANNPVSFVDPTGEDILFWQLNKKGEYEQVTFNKLDKKVQQGIIDFAKTDAGYDFLANFANAGDKLGNSGISFSKDGKNSKHNFNVLQMDNPERSEGTSDERVSKNKIDFYLEINKDMSNPKINMAETMGHEAFLHMYSDMNELIKAFETKGWASAYDLSIKQYQNNKRGYKDHLSVKDDKKGRAKMYYEFITQLKSVLNPNEVQKHVNKEVEKTYNAGKNDAPKK